MKNFVPRSIAFNYPGFQSLPKGIKRLLLVTESHFFGQERSRPEPEKLPVGVYFPAAAVAVPNALPRM